VPLTLQDFAGFFAKHDKTNEFYGIVLQDKEDISKFEDAIKLSTGIAQNQNNKIKVEETKELDLEADRQHNTKLIAQARGARDTIKDIREEVSLENSEQDLLFADQMILSISSGSGINENIKGNAR
jgi:hypothetical protein